MKIFPILATVLSLVWAGLSPAHPDHSGSEMFDAAEMAAAEVILDEFLGHLHDGDFTAALELYGGSFRSLEGWNPDLDPADRVGLLKRGCEVNGLQCYLLGRVIERTEGGVGRFLFKAELMMDDGSTYVREPCCGESGPAVKVFEFEVRRRNGDFLVHTLPPYQA